MDFDEKDVYNYWIDIEMSDICIEGEVIVILNNFE